VQASLQPANRQPGSAAAERTTRAVASKVAEHVAPQSIPVGADRTAPEPVVRTVTV